MGSANRMKHSTGTGLDELLERGSPIRSQTIVGIDPEGLAAELSDVVAATARDRAKTPTEKAFYEFIMAMYFGRLADGAKSIPRSDAQPAGDTVPVENKYSFDRSLPGGALERIDVRDISLPSEYGHFVLFRHERPDGRIKDTVSFVPSMVYMDGAETAARRVYEAIIMHKEETAGQSWLPTAVHDLDHPQVSASGMGWYFTLVWEAHRDIDDEAVAYATSGIDLMLSPLSIPSFSRVVDGAVRGVDMPIPQELVDTVQVADEEDDFELPVEFGSVTELVPAVIPSISDYDEGDVLDLIEGDDGTCFDAGELAKSVLDSVTDPVAVVYEMRSYASLIEDGVSSDVSVLTADAFAQLQERYLVEAVSALLVLYESGGDIYAVHIDKDGLSQMDSADDSVTRDFVYGTHLRYQLVPTYELPTAVNAFVDAHQGKPLAMFAPDHRLYKEALDALHDRRSGVQTDEDILKLGVLDLAPQGGVVLLGEMASMAIADYLADHSADFW